MTTFPGAALLATLPIVVAAVVGLAALACVIGTRIARHNVVDTFWGLLFVGAGAAAVLASVGYGDPARRWLLLAMVTLWGARLAVHTGRRALGKGEDPRYESMLATGLADPTANAVVKIYLPQALLALLIAAPLWTGALVPGRVGLLGALGVAVWALGLFFETVGDAQMERYKAWKKAQPRDAVEGGVMDKGLWRYTRHPNYFGDACVWWGIFLVAAEHWPGVLTLPAPLLMTYLLTRGSGKKNLERSMARRPGYPEYMRRTSGFVPLPPRNEPAGPPAREPDPADISVVRRSATAGDDGPDRSRGT